MDFIEEGTGPVLLLLELVDQPVVDVMTAIEHAIASVPGLRLGIAAAANGFEWPTIGAIGCIFETGTEP